ncbi:hypothetical protein GOODEAATRI_006700 [Goodea atripinnis]|uniref:FH2 domain-containing protein n=1 Tax=Goodea atripinnis TaxID=208336 RepID=A0ABV0N8G9_9TELE
MTRFGKQTIWAGLEPVHLDTNRLEYLFESKATGTSFTVVSGRQLAMEQLAASQTFRCILATVLAIGNFLNGCKVRDTHTRQPLLHHVCVLLLQLYPQSSDLYSDITAVTKAGKCDYSQVQSNLVQLEATCKASWEQFHSFLLFLGYSRTMVRDTRAEDFCRTISNFSLEYRSTRQAVLLQREREQQKSGAESPGPSTPVGRRKCQQTPASQVAFSNASTPNRFTHLVVKFG